jgi:2-oxoglutarate dehydrogenase E1 component
MSASPRAVPPSINSWSAEYLEAQYLAYKADQSAVPADMLSFFQGFDLATARGVVAAAASGLGETLKFQAAVAELIEAYRSLGHLAAKLDPFGREPARPVALTLGYHGLSDRDLDRSVDVGTLPAAAGSTLRQIVAFLERTYCSSIGIQSAHLTSAEERAWLLQRFEQDAGRIPLDRGDKAHILERLVRAEQFERFLQKRYQGEKRFSIEGGESLIPLLDRIIEAGAALGVEELVIGMAHRGRLNVLNTILGKTYEQIFTEFEDSYTALGGGDVKYHRGYSGDRPLRSGKSVHLAMASNPSHLESVDPVVAGRCRAKQRLRGDTERRRVVPILIHGDAAIIGQGIVAETLNLSQLEGYTTGGTIHVVVNNLVGFTTGPQDSRSTRYCTDVALMIESPVLHVNGEDPDAVVACAQFAAEYRQKFRKDVLVDLYCYRKYGHNEQDEASFTQPAYTRLVQEAPGVLRRYSAQLQSESVLTQGDLDALSDRLTKDLESAQAAAKQKPFDPTIDPGSKKWAGFKGEFTFDPVNTSVKQDVIDEVTAALGRVPEGFNLNPKLVKLLADRAALPKTKGQVAMSYADAESLAFGTLLLEGVAVRLSGQDCRRGTFSHRHAVLRDFQTEEKYTPLNAMRAVAETPDQVGKRGADSRPAQARFCVYDSPLSEAAVMGFDYGYSLADPNMLIMWEGQFGDFVNGAQTIIDQYLASAETKWERWSGLVLLLPHGYEGAGPEHSSARMERFLQLCGDNNLLVAYPSTAAQCFHMLRRQIKAKYRKPLIVMTPKSMLRTPTSDIAELTSGSFQHLLDDSAFAAGKHDPKKVSRVLLCTGKIYHELAARREATGRFDTAIVRVEQLYPFDSALCKKILARYPASAKKFWVQEEPRNMGAYLFIADVLREQLDLNVTYIGRVQSATPAVGSKTKHKYEQESILAEAVAPLPKDASKAASPAANGAHAGNGSHAKVSAAPAKKAKA